MASSKNYPFLLEIRSPEERGRRASATRGEWVSWRVVALLVAIGTAAVIGGRQLFLVAMDECATRACVPTETFGWTVATIAGGALVTAGGVTVVFALYGLMELLGRSSRPARGLGSSPIRVRTNESSE